MLAHYWRSSHLPTPETTPPRAADRVGVPLLPLVLVEKMVKSSGHKMGILRYEHVLSVERLAVLGDEVDVSHETLSALATKKGEGADKRTVVQRI